MAEFDHGSKKIAETAGRPLARLAGLRPSQWRAVESTVQSVEKLADRAFLARQRRERFVVYFEFFATWRAEARWDMLAKSGLLSQREKLPTKCIAVILRQEEFHSQDGQFRLEVAGRPTQQLWFEEVCLWQLTPEPWWQDEPGLMALYPLCHHGQQPRDAIVHAVAAIEQKVPANADRGTFLALLGIFGQLGYPTLDARAIIGVEKMKESKFYQDVMRDGAIAARRADILRFLRARFKVDPPAEIGTALDLASDERLDSLVDLAATCPDLRAFQDALVQPTTPTRTRRRSSR